MDTHPPGLFQIDGNMGAANGMLEALVQSRWMPEATEVELLPALPEQWSVGSVEGVCVRGGAILDMRWKAGKLISLKLRAKSDGAIRLIPPEGQAVSAIHNSAGGIVAAETDHNTIRTERGMSYTILFR
jgi:alpha-L-fucosidase 2